MPTFSQRSIDNLSECHPDLQVIAAEAIKGFDFMVYEGHRSQAEQDKAFYAGKSKLKYPDSKHNRKPSMAFDAAPYPIDWNNRERFYALAWYIKGIADRLFLEGKISHRVRLGADWDGNNNPRDNWEDLPHIELI